MSIARLNEREEGRTSPSSTVENPHLGNRLSRRQWLTGVTALAATAMVPARQAAAQTGAARPYRIDTHHHHSANWNQAIEAMDRSGIATAILSRPAIPVSEPEMARKLARDTNEYATQVARDHPGRFGVFATLPLFDVEGSLREVAYAFDVLKADGVCVVTSYGNKTGYADKWVGDPTFAPVFDELNRRKAVAFVHPVTPTCCTDLTPRIQPAALELMFDTVRAIVSVILNGTLVRCPEIRFIFGHGGGGLPFLHERLDHLIGQEQSTGPDGGSDGGFRSPYVPNGFDNEMKKVYFDTVRVANPADFALLTKLMPPEHLLLGTDYPVVPTSETVGHLPGLHLDATVLRGIERDNAVALFPRFKA